MRKLFFAVLLACSSLTANAQKIDFSCEKYFITEGVAYDKNQDGEISESEFVKYKDEIHGSFYFNFKYYGNAGSLLKIQWVLNSDGDTVSNHELEDAVLYQVKTEGGINYSISDKNENLLIMLLKTENGYIPIFYELALMM